MPTVCCLQNAGSFGIGFVFCGGLLLGFVGFTEIALCESVEMALFYALLGVGDPGLRRDDDVKCTLPLFLVCESVEMALFYALLGVGDPGLRRDDDVKCT